MTGRNNTERARLHVQRRLAAGGRNLRVVLRAPAAAALARLEASGMTALQAVEYALCVVDDLPPRPAVDSIITPADAERVTP